MTDEWSDELVALQSIYDNILIISETCIEIPFKGDHNSCSLRVEITLDYPETCPNLTLLAHFLNKNAKDVLISEMKATFEAGEPVIFAWAEMLREALTKNDENPVQTIETIPLKVKIASIEFDIEIFQGEPIIDRKSTFQAFYAKVHSCEEAKNFRLKLLENAKIARATHNMFVYKLNKNGIIKSDSDEDGEHGAGNELT
jgi:hypothetical protein